MTVSSEYYIQFPGYTTMLKSAYILTLVLNISAGELLIIIKWNLSESVFRSINQVIECVWRYCNIPMWNWLKYFSIMGYQIKLTSNVYLDCSSCHSSKDAIHYKTTEFLYYCWSYISKLQHYFFNYYHSCNFTTGKHYYLQWLYRYPQYQFYKWWVEEYVFIYRIRSYTDYLIIFIFIAKS